LDLQQEQEREDLAEFRDLAISAGVEPVAIAPLLVGSLVGVPVGVVVLARLDSTVLQLTVAVTVLVASLTLFSSPRAGAVQVHPVTALAAGGLSGALRAAIHVRPASVLYALSRFGDDVERLANVLASSCRGAW
jgi:uncharacterized membrane protein YfcA